MPSSLESTYLDCGASLVRHYATDVVNHFGNPIQEIEVLRNRVGLLDVSYNDRLKVTGNDAVDLLNRLSTNQLEGMETGSVRWTIITTPKGRIMDVIKVAKMEDHLFVGVSPQRAQSIIDWIDFYTFGEDIRVEDISQHTIEFAVIGPGTEAVLSAFGPNCNVSENNTCGIATCSAQEVTVVRADMKSFPRVNVICSGNIAEVVWRTLLDIGESEKIEAVGFQAADFLRVSLGIPMYGFELDDKVDPLTAGLLDYVNFDKGCYIGQEVVARLNTYQKVKKKLMMIELDGLATIGDELYYDKLSIGELTSIASVEMGKSKALGYVKKGYATPGLACTIGEASSARGLVIRECSMTG